MRALRLLAPLAVVLGVAACTDASYNPPGTAVERAVDRQAGTNTSGAYPAQSDGRRANPPGTAAQRAYDRQTGSNTSGAYPQNR